MWIEKAAENTYDVKNLFEEFLNKEVFDSIKVIGKEKIAGGEEVYVVKATQYVKNIEKTFYFNDFSVGVDLMENSYPRKQRDVLNDVEWTLVVASRLNKEDKKQYKAEAREYQMNQVKENLDLIKEFYGKMKAKKWEETISKHKETVDEANKELYRLDRKFDEYIHSKLKKSKKAQKESVKKES